MSSSKRYISGPSTEAGQPTFIPGGEWKNRGVSPVTVILVTVVLIAVVVLITYLMVKGIKTETLEQTSGADLLNLDALINLKTDGQCCLPPAALLTTKEWIYSPSNNFTFSTTKTAPAIVCQGLTGVNLNNCLNYVSDSNGDPKILAHYGVTPYYPFSPGTAGGVCSSYGTC